MLGNRTWDEWIAQYATSHQNPVNRFCHTIGIPMIVLSLFVGVAALVLALISAPLIAAQLGWIALALFVVGWLFQFVGHAFEGKPPEFLSDWRFLLVGTRWWAAKIRGKA